MNDSSRGFHLIEILIVAAIISLLATLCLPLYTKYIVQLHRVVAANTLSKLAIAMEKFHIEHNSYEDATLKALNFPDTFATNNYQLMIQSATNSDYTLAANPIGKQAERDKQCGSFILYSNDKKAVTGSAGVNECW